jgi:hypothetical protein
MELQQDALDEAFRRHKNYFQHFLENEVRALAVWSSLFFPYLLCTS